MGFFSDFHYTSDYPVGLALCEVEDGIHECIVGSTKIESDPQTGVRFASITLTVKDSNGVPFDYRIKEGEKFDQQFSRFLDAFKIPLTNSNAPKTWTNKVGKCNFWHSEYNGKKYLNCMPIPEPKDNKAGDGNSEFIY